MTDNQTSLIGDSASQGGMDVTISLTRDEMAALGSEAAALIDALDTALWTITLLRNGANPRTPENPTVTAANLSESINQLDRYLLPRLQGVRDAAIRQHNRLGGSLGELSRAMDVAKSTAQSRRNVVLNRKPSERKAVQWERWATSLRPDDHREHCQACGHPSRPSDPIVATTGDGPAHIHQSHTTDPDDGFYGTATD
ncbi:hypothetical protein [Streptomyces sp. NPDC087300]|uniref:hypothetical protein n=1 Tax=Streptomyces sp. NPDC087300 TaxID=3365780 RepID=UPI003816EA1E